MDTDSFTPKDQPQDMTPAGSVKQSRYGTKPFDNENHFT